MLVYRKKIRRLFLLQLGAALLAFSFWGTILGENGFKSALAGAGIAIIPLWLFGAIFLRPGSRIGEFYIGELIKWLVTGVLFFVAITWLKVAMLPTLSTFGLVLMVLWFSLL